MNTPSQSWGILSYFYPIVLTMLHFDAIMCISDVEIQHDTTNLTEIRFPHRWLYAT